MKKECSLFWWDDMCYYIYGINSINVINFELMVLVMIDLYEENNYMCLVFKIMEIK